MKKLIMILSVILFAHQASADQLNFEIGDIFSCISQKFVELNGIEKGDNVSVFRVVEDVATLKIKFCESKAKRMGS